MMIFDKKPLVAEKVSMEVFVAQHLKPIGLGLTSPMGKWAWAFI